MLRVVYGGSGDEIGKDGDVRGQDVKTGKIEKAVLLSFLLLYSNDNKISVCDSRPSSCPTYMFYQLLLLLTTNAR